MSRVIAAFLNSLRGLRGALVTERAVRQELAMLIAGFALTPFLARTIIHAAALIGVLLGVLAVELLNTAVEKLSDHVTPEHHEEIRYVKDLGSAAVFCALALAALVWIATIIDHVLS